MRVDALGGAAFQELFGDPVSNSKGWPGKIVRSGMWRTLCLA